MDRPFITKISSALAPPHALVPAMRQAHVRSQVRGYAAVTAPSKRPGRPRRDALSVLASEASQAACKRPHCEMRQRLLPYGPLPYHYK
jgi:hypothetical protein